jgi:PAS domain S-box-containing protein
VAEEILPRGYSDVYEKEYRRKSGTIFPVELRAFLTRDADGQPAMMWAIVRDITRRKLAEKALRDASDTLEARVKERTAELEAANVALRSSEERYRSLVNNLNVGVYRNTIGPQGRFLHANPALARMHGYDSVEEFQKIRIKDLYQEPGERKSFVANLLRQGSVLNHELRLKKKDGTPMYGSISATVHRSPDGEVDWIDGVLEDITQRKRAEQSLAEALELNRTLIEASTVGIGAYKASGQCVLANEALAQITGGLVEQLRQQDFRRLKSWRRDGLLAKADAALATRQPQQLETRSVTTFGREAVINARFSSFTIQGEQHLLFMLTDETRAQRAQEALRTSEERYRALAESSPDVIFILDRDIKIQYVNSTAAAWWKRAPEELIGLTQAELFPPAVAQNHRRAVAEVLATRKPVRRDELLAFPTGEQWIEIRLVPLQGDEGTVSSIMGVCRDITERKRAERQLAEALDLNQKMIAASTVGITAYKATGECIFTNEALAQAVGGSVSEVGHADFRRLASWKKSGLLKVALDALGQGQPRSGEFHATSQFGKGVWLDCHLAPFVSNGQPHLLLMALDISQRKQAEEAVKLQSLMVQNMAEAALLVGPELTILFANAALENSFGYKPGELIGQEVAVLNAWSKEETARFNAEVIRATQQDGAWFGEYQNRRKDGTLFTSEARIRALDLGGRMHFVSVQQDITERKRLERQILEISDREQARIGQDIHDGLCQHLVSLAFDANSLKKQLAAQRRPEAKTARRLADFLDQAITESRQLSRGLFPVRLEKEGLAPALEELAGTIRSRFKLQCRFEGKGGLGVVEDSTVATHLYRIAREAVTNAVKHSQAQRVRIRLRDRAGQIELRIEDNGAGLSSETQRESKGMGLYIMDYRARMIGASLQVKHRPRGGTIVSCCVPRPGS